jgi:hypothetical protein
VATATATATATAPQAAVAAANLLASVTPSEMKVAVEAVSEAMDVGPDNGWPKEQEVQTIVLDQDPEPQPGPSSVKVGFNRLYNF